MTNDRKFEWIDNAPAVCVSVVIGATDDEACAVIGRPHDIEFASLRGAADWVSGGYPRFWYATGTVENVSFVWEENGFRGADRDVADALPSSAAFASVYWNVNSLSAFTFARSGEVVTQFEILWAPNEEEWQSLVAAGAERVTDGEWKAAPWERALILQSQVSGSATVAHPSWLELPGVRFWGASF